MKQSFTKIMKTGLTKLQTFVNDHSSEILLGCGITGFIATTVLVAKEAPIAKDRLDELHEELAETGEDVSNTQIFFKEVKAVAPVYLPAVLSGGLSVGCVLASYRITSNRAASLATAYELAQSNLLEYQEKVKTKFGEKKEKQIRDDIAQDKVNKNPPPQNYISAPLGDGQQWFFEPVTNQYFRSTVDEIRKAEKAISDMLHSGYADFISVNEFLYEIGSSELCATFPIGDKFGFWVDRNGIDISFSSVVAPGPMSALSLEYEYYSRTHTDHIFE